LEKKPFKFLNPAAGLFVSVNELQAMKEAKQALFADTNSLFL
jgi:hypothetical protein